MSPNDQKVLDLWDSETKYKNGHYTVPIPWKQGKLHLPDNESLAFHRLMNLRKRLEKSNCMVSYDTRINEFIDKGYAEQVPEDELRLADGLVF